ncbi:LrgB family protein [Barnesiella sp. WM24]|uniref:LrgB family protein n=1 Tax=Barnesiella sp. WM24 TaxID=2558278 RepID=UPI000A731FC5|nr:LrgB family protein [Barnesiella sp. WM24]MDE6114256.1 LrgB family protein [Muribaculum sp.]TFU94296.1 LrgB family protein [Barnesiella sp. WM24]
MSYLENKYFLIALTFVVYVTAQIIQKRTGMSFLNPILVTIAVLICILMSAGVDYQTYAAGGDYIDFWLKPAVVALGVPLYRQLEAIKKQLLPILLAELAGCIAGVVSVVVVAQLLGASKEVILSLAPKSVTTPIAMEIAQTVGGIPALTAAVVVCTGIFGGMAGFKMMKYSRVKSPIAQGLSMGTAAHAVGTSAAMDVGYRYGAFSSLGLTLNGLFTALLTPLILSLLGYA